MIHLQPTHQTKLLNVINQHIPDVDILVYGSRINGRSHDGSDLDIALRTPDRQAISIEKIEQLTQAIDSINLPFIVDLHDWSALPQSFKDEINQQAIVLNEHTHTT